MYAKHESSYSSAQLEDLSEGHHCKKNLQPQEKRKILIYKVTLTTFQQSYKEKLHSSAYLKLHLSSDTLTTKIHLNSKIEELCREVCRKKASSQTPVITWEFEQKCCLWKPEQLEEIKLLLKWKIRSVHLSRKQLNEYQKGSFIEMQIQCQSTLSKYDTKDSQMYFEKPLRDYCLRETIYVNHYVFVKLYVYDHQVNKDVIVRTKRSSGL